MQTRWHFFSYPDDPAPSSNGPSASNDDIFDSFVSGPSPSSGAVTQNPAPSTATSATSQQTENSIPASSSLSGLDESLFGDNSQGGENAKSTKDSIMALFGPSGGGGGNQQMFGVPGLCKSLIDFLGALMFEFIQLQVLMYKVLLFFLKFELGLSDGFESKTTKHMNQESWKIDDKSYETREFQILGGMYMQQPQTNMMQQPQTNMMGGMQNGMMPNNMMGGGMMGNTNMMQQPNMQVSGTFSYHSSSVGMQKNSRSNIIF